jgi:hypothetical protein
VVKLIRLQVTYNRIIVATEICRSDLDSIFEAGSSFEEVSSWQGEGASCDALLCWFHDHDYNQVILQADRT